MEKLREYKKEKKSKKVKKAETTSSVTLLYYLKKYFIYCNTISW